MSDLFGNHIVGFPTRWLKLLITGHIASEAEEALIAVLDDFEGFIASHQLVILSR